MRGHLQEKHAIDPARLSDSVYLGGERRESQIISWNPANETFLCRLCPGAIYWTGEITEEMVGRALRHHGPLRPHLTGLTEPGEREEMARRVLSGDLNRERLRQLRGADARRRSARGRRPTVELRRQKVQPWLLERVRARGVLERVLDEAEAMQRTDPAAWARLCDRPVSRETLRDWWQDIDPQTRAEAFAAGRAAAKNST